MSQRAEPSCELQGRRAALDRFIPRKASPVNFRLPGAAGEAAGDYAAELGNLLEDDQKTPEGLRTPLGSKRKVLFFGSQPRAGSASGRKNDGRGKFDTREAKILDAPGMADSFYLNPLAFSRSDELAVGLGGDLHLFPLMATRSRPVFADPESAIASVRFSDENPEALAFGSTAGVLRIADVGAATVLRQFPAEEGRVAALDWHHDVLATGTRHGHIIMRDLRSKARSALTLSAHTHEVCALAFSPFDPQQLLSGSNDDTVALSDLRSPLRECARFSHHRAAVKALCWHPTKRGLFVSGGGARDQRLAVVDACSEAVLRSALLGTQICGASFNREGQIVVATGFPTLSLQIHDPQTLAAVHSFPGHADRLLYLAVNRGRSLAATGSPDQSIRYWNVCASKLATAATQAEAPSVLLR